MTHLAVYGIGQGLDGRDAALQATQKALDQLGALRPALALAFAADDYDLSSVLTGLAALLGDTPLWGFSSLRPLAGDAEHPRSVVVALLTGSDLKAQTAWWPGHAADPVETARQALRALRSELVLPQGVLFAADGVNGSTESLCAGLADLPSGIAGCLASGGYSSGMTHLLAKNQSGSGALITAALHGRFRLSAACAHGWRDSGLTFTITRTRDVWVHTLDNQPAAEVYARFFGRSAREWAYPPLNELVRLYPFGTETYSGGPLTVHAPLRMEVDGSLRMSARVPDGAAAHLMIGDPQACLDAVEQAARRALDDLETARPMLALAFVDAAWLPLFGVQTERIPAAIQEALGSIPVVGAYTLGQAARARPAYPPEVYNQSVEIVLIGYQE